MTDSNDSKIMPRQFVADLEYLKGQLVAQTDAHGMAMWLLNYHRRFGADRHTVRFLERNIERLMNLSRSLSMDIAAVLHAIEENGNAIDETGPVDDDTN